MSGEKTRKIDTRNTISSHEKQKYIMLIRLSDNLLRLEHHAGLKNRADKLRKLATANIDLRLVLTAH